MCYYKINNEDPLPRTVFQKMLLSTPNCLRPEAPERKKSLTAETHSFPSEDCSRLSAGNLLSELSKWLLEQEEFVSSSLCSTVATFGQRKTGSQEETCLCICSSLSQSFCTQFSCHSHGRQTPARKYRNHWCWRWWHCNQLQLHSLTSPAVLLGGNGNANSVMKTNALGWKRISNRRLQDKLSFKGGKNKDNIIFLQICCCFASLSPAQ